MKVKVFNGKKEAEKILDALKKKIVNKKLAPRLAVISVGHDLASKLFIDNKKRAARKIGLAIVHYSFEAHVSEKKILSLINALNEAPLVDGIIVQLPLPKKFNTNRVINRIFPEKDVDAFSKGKKRFEPPLSAAILIALKKSNKKLADKKILAVVNSDVFGETLKGHLREKGIKVEYLLRKNLSAAEIKSADALITVCGVPGLIRGEMIKRGAVLIDAGITVLKDKKVAGDIDRESSAAKSSFITPVPGGIGPLTVALLLKNVYSAYEKYRQTD